jgi:hypothetical protein
VERIRLAALTSGSNPQSVKIVVVTKKQPLELIRAVISAGAQHLGENYADEALPKIDALRGDRKINWHMIGHVQSRKAEMVCRNFDYVHSLDSLKLAERYNHFAGEIDRKLPILLQFNVSGEGTKSGWNAWNESQWVQFLPDIEKIVALENLLVQGVMTMPPYTDNPEDARPYFQRLVSLRNFLASCFTHNSWDELSMGMSGDYEVAVQEGATWVRIGQAILGPRV